MKPHDFRAQSPSGHWIAASVCRYCGKTKREVPSTMAECMASPPTPAVKRWADPERTIVLESVSRHLVSYSPDAQRLSVHGGSEYDLAGKNPRADLSYQVSAARAVKASAGGLVAGATILPVVGTAYGLARGFKSAKIARLHIFADDLNLVIETTDKLAAQKLADAINRTVVI